ncbi:MAG: methyltransferase domain-containing protein, partial [Clostridia bacterium]|nr:methyltransferase domain-containing protein [Clostridia bacterium]
ILMSELTPHGKVTACDIHPHRVKLIQTYKERMHTPNVKTVVFDTSKFNEEWEERFDYVLLDAPCSCFGTFRKHPDVFLSREEKDIADIAKTQREILKNAVRYLKNGGTLVYSTCTLFDEENSQAVNFVLEKGKYELEKITFDSKVLNDKFAGNNGMISILPHAEYDGFFIAKIKRI